MGQVSVQINGQQYRIACGDGEEDRVRELGKTFDNYVAEIAGSVGQVGDARLMLLAALILADELAEAQEESRVWRRRAEGAEERTQAGSDSLDNMASRIEKLVNGLTPSA